MNFLPALRDLPVRFPVLVMFICVMAACNTPMSLHAADDLGPHLSGLSRDDVIRLGSAMYRDGVLPSGEQLKAIVKGDVLVDGKMFTCTSCHLRSGFGSMEGTIRTAPIDGTRLYSPLSRFKGIPRRGVPGGGMAGDLYRPAYTDETLAAVIRTGVDPAGRNITDVMPLYPLSDRDTAIMVYYLKTLSTGTQPGVTDTTLRFATVITDDVSQEDREAMLVPLQSYINKWRISKNMERMTRSGAYIQEGSSQLLRTLSLAVWELKGPPETWRSQLEDYYRRNPVFALLGGITTREWAPIHQFCEDHKIPSIFPITDFPVISPGDWYTLYLSKGLYQEGETAARYLQGREDLAKKELTVVQVFRNDRAGLALSKAFQDTWMSLGNKTPVNLSLGIEEKMTADLWKSVPGKNKRVVVLFWMNANDLPALNSLSKTHAPAMVLVSSSLLGRSLFSLPEKTRKSVYITYPYMLPQEAKTARAQIEASLKNSIGSVSSREATFKMYSLFSTLTGPLARLRTYVYQDYFLELIESGPDQSNVAGVYPRLSFGTGQRYASKGCYIVQLTGGPDPELVKRSEWVIH